MTVPPACSAPAGRLDTELLLAHAHVQDAVALVRSALGTPWVSDVGDRCRAELDARLAELRRLAWTLEEALPAVRMVEAAGA